MTEEWCDLNSKENERIEALFNGGKLNQLVRRKIDEMVVPRFSILF